jgi:hypothetical protein
MIRTSLLLPLLTAALFGSSCSSEDTHTGSLEKELSFRELQLPTDSLARYPHLLADEAGGRLWMSWLVQHRPDSASLWRAALDEERGEWQTPELITSGQQLMVNWADYPHLVAQEGSEPGLLYLQVADASSPYAYHVMWQVAGASARRLHSDSSATEHGFVSAARMPEGHMGVIWLDGRNYAGAEDAHGHAHGGEMTLRYRPISANGDLLPSLELDGRTCDCCNTAMVSTSDGALAFYRDRSEDEIRDIYYTRYQEGQWQQPQLLNPDGWEMRACPVNGPAADAQGNAVAVAWFTAAQGNNQVKVSFSNNGGESWQPVLVADSLQPMGRVGIQLLSGNSALVSWLDKEGQLAVRQVTADGQMGPIQILASSLSARKSGFPQLLRLKDKVYIAWTQPDPQTHLRMVEGVWRE